MGKIKPGQYWSPDGSKIVRAAKRTNGCKNCILNDPFLCPNIKAKNAVEVERPDCIENGIIFVFP